MRTIRSIVVLAAAVAGSACQQGPTPKVDDALRQDLSLASQVQPYTPQQYLSPVEQGYGYAPAGYYPQPRYAPSPYYQPQPIPTRVIYRTAPHVVRRASGPAPVYQGSSGGVYGGESEPPIENTKRDAIIGAAAGAAIGVASTRNTLKGAIIGAAAGGLLGAVVGHKIDVRRP